MKERIMNKERDDQFKKENNITEREWLEGGPDVWRNTETYQSLAIQNAWSDLKKEIVKEIERLILKLSKIFNKIFNIKEEK